MQNQPVNPSLVPMYERLTTALGAFALGDPEPYKALWAHTEDVSGYDDLEVLASGAGTDMAYVVWLERISATSAAGDAVTRQRRITHVLRRDGDGWLIVHQHGDPLVDLVPPS